MIVSRMMAKRRIAAQERPSALAAWVLVVVDFLAVAVVAWLIWLPLYAWLDGAQYPIVFTAGILFCILFIPTQFLLILSALWAVKSRWIGEEEGPG